MERPTDEGLFRAQAVAHAGRRLTGKVVLKSSFPTQLLSALLTLLVLGGGIVALNASFARKETVPGYVTPTGGLVRLTAAQGGTVQAVHVIEGQAVREGDPIVTMRLSPSVQGGDSYAKTVESQAVQRQAAVVRGETAIGALEAEQAQIRQRLGVLRLRLGQSRRRVALQEERLELARSEWARIAPVAERGFITSRELDARRSAVLQAEQTLADMTARMLEEEQQISEANNRLAAIPNDLRAARAEAESIRARLDQEAVQSEGLAIYQVVATISGRVGALPVGRGQAVSPGGGVGVLMPFGESLFANLYAPSRSAGFIAEGQEVRLLYQAFPFQKFGAGRGTVVAVSNTVIAPSDLAVSGLAIDEPVFQVRVRLDQPYVEAYGRQVPLQPGMLVTADVIADRRTFLEWLLDPLYAVGRRGA